MPKLPLSVRVFVLPVGACALAALITWKPWPVIQPSASPLFFLAVMSSALYGGVVAGLVATLLSAIATAYLAETPELQLSHAPLQMVFGSTMEMATTPAHVTLPGLM